MTRRLPVLRALASAALRLPGPPAQARHGITVEPPGRDVDLQVELPKLGRPSRIGDRIQHVGVLHGRRTAIVHEVELDLQAHL